MLTSEVAGTANLVETSMFERVRVLGLVGRNAAFLLVSLVYLTNAPTAVGGVFFAVLLAWSVYRLLTRRENALLIVDVAFVVIAAFLEPLIVPATISDVSMSATRAIAYPVIVMLGVFVPRRWSLPATLGFIAASAVGDTILFGQPSITLLAFLLSWAASSWVHVLIQRAAAATDALAVEVRTARLRERVAAARTRFEREHFATLHDTAASTLMMIGDAASLDSKRLAAQAARDVEILTTGTDVADPDRDVDLVELVVAVSREAQTRVVVDHSGPVIVPAVIASAAAAATREALNNVDRHAGASSVRISVRSGKVSIADNGAGFDTSKRHGFGMRFSIEGRMRRAGGTGTVVSAPGAGTTVELTWSELPAEPLDDSVDRQRVVRNFHYGLAAASFLVAIEMLVIGFGASGGIETWFSAVVVVVLFATSAVASWLAYRGGELLRWTWITLVLVLGVVHVVSVPAHQLGTVPNWVSISVGWALVALLASWVSTARQVVYAAGLVIGFWVVRGVVRVWRMPTGEVFEYASYGLASVGTMQVAAISCAWVIAEAVKVAELLGRQRHAAATRRAVEEAIQLDYRRHFASITADVVGLLRVVADGRMALDEREVHVRAQTEYARLRRLFAQADSFEHPLIQRLRPVLDAAGERGADVALDIANRPPDLAEHDIDAIVAAIDGLVSGATDRVRLVISSSSQQLTVSVVADCADDIREQVRTALADTDFQLTVDNQVTWLRVHVPVAVTV